MSEWVSLAGAGRDQGHGVRTGERCAAGSSATRWRMLPMAIAFAAISAATGWIAARR